MSAPRLDPGAALERGFYVWPEDDELHVWIGPTCTDADAPQPADGGDTYWPSMTSALEHVGRVYRSRARFHAPDGFCGLCHDAPLVRRGPSTVTCPACHPRNVEATA